MHPMFFRRTLKVEDDRRMTELLALTAEFEAPADAIHVGLSNLAQHSALVNKWDLVHFQFERLDAHSFQVRLVLRSFWDRWRDQPVSETPYLTFTVTTVHNGVAPMLRPATWQDIGQPLAAFIDAYAAGDEVKEGPADHLHVVYGILRHLSDQVSVLRRPTFTAEQRYSASFAYTVAEEPDYTQVDVEYDHAAAVGFWAAYHAAIPDLVKD